jgi:hypothetical protein
MSTTEEQPEIKIEADYNTEQYQNNENYHSDAEGIRRKFSVKPFNPDVFSYPNVYANAVSHVQDGQGPPRGATKDKGGTDLLCIAKPGHGKSTFLLHNALRVMENNDEAVVWRGSSSRSEWLPFAPWARVCLPAGRSVTVELQPPDPTKSTITDVELEDIVREVVYYEDPVQLNQELLKPGQFHVVYPDPGFRGCQKLYRESDKAYSELSFEKEHPAIHWWFAWVLARIEHGPHMYTSLIFDEIGDWVPQSASKDFSLYQKIEMLVDLYVDARKLNLSFFTAGHSESDIHEKMRKKVRWRVRFAGLANPTRVGRCNGFNSIPMDKDFMSSAPVGEALCFNEINFERLSYPHYPKDMRYKVQVKLQ